MSAELDPKQLALLLQERDWSDYLVNELARLRPKMPNLRRHLTYSLIADTAGVNKGFISQVERGDISNVSFDALERILQVYQEMEKHDASRANAGAREESRTANVA